MADALGVASVAAGLISLGIVLCQGILNYYGSWKDAGSDVQRMYASTEALTKTFILLKLSIENKKFNRDIVIRVNESIDSCEDGINDLKKKLKKIELVSLDDQWSGKVKAQFRRTLYPFKESTLVKLKEITSGLQDQLNLATTALQM
jgi:ankyrin repeat domain-containing protein 50